MKSLPRKLLLLFGLIGMLTHPLTGQEIHIEEKFALVGFATLDGGTTGGQGGEIVTASTGYEIEEVIGEKQDGEYPDGLNIIVNGTISQDNTEESKISVKDLSDLSIIGQDSSGIFDGIGIKIWKASNIIIRNLTIHHVSEGEGDCVSIEGPADHIWVDHCTLYNDLDHDKDYYDGLLDAKRDCDYITISWNYLHHSYKTSLVGSSDDDVYNRRLNYHHNWIDTCNSRLPAYRFGHGHIFNNYYSRNIETGINARQGADLVIEKNYFENMLNPIGYWYSDSTGYWNLSDNLFVNCEGSQPTTSTTDYVPPYEYRAVLDSVENVKSTVMKYAGAGVISTTTATREEKPIFPTDFYISAAYPNPFNPVTTIDYHLPGDSPVQISVTSIRGEVIHAAQINGTNETRHFTFDGAQLSSGIYFVRFEAANYQTTRKIILVK
ncbi:MAG: T9SS type A sorting domain-containing protein [Candidatus Marinimicrobia bacterium]|nr:T9SS type A sorting domain-containing protein [Candidatus Neomarinimicrobiota bacterium]MCF7829516.1 T9SS type A sorting domain-containing protein [Candidatus Neomarinimicrobiota bacterium]MCF7880086.1 T9SS type A sorting domain-containing protein [Candidatus Neomarinimicrobiota bacterium]